MATTKVKRRKKVPAASYGLAVGEVKGADWPSTVISLAKEVRGDGGEVLAAYRDPLGGFWQLFAVLPLDRVEPTAFQRNLSDTHVKRLAQKIERLNRFLDPIIVVRSEKGVYLTPNGFHRWSALKRLGARSITALVIPEPELAYQILALNTEKAHNVREKSLEAIRMARELANISPGELESDYANEFEEASFLTLGVCYETKGQFSGGAYYPVLRKTDHFQDEKLPRAIGFRERRAKRLFELDAKVVKVVDALKENGLKSPYLKTFVVARINPLRFQKGGTPDFEATFDKMLASLAAFDPAKVKPQHLASLGGAPAED